MFVNEILSSPRYVEGRKFIERTIESKFDKANVSIKTVYMNDKPILKEYTFENDNIVKFIDFSNDGYTRTNRKKSSSNLKDTDHAKERYQEVVDLVRFGRNKLKYLHDNEYYEGTINIENGADWNQTAPIDTIPHLEDFKKTVSDYLAWEVSNLLRNSTEDNCLGK